MGSNNAKVVNETNQDVIILVFSNSNLLQWYYRTLHYVPSGADVEVSGLEGGGAIKIGVVYSTYEGKYVFDLYRVPNHGTLHVKEINPRGVRCTSAYNGSVEIVKKGLTIHMNANAQEGTKFWLGVTFDAVLLPFKAISVLIPNDEEKSQS